jgi:hypothetical protein
MGCEEYSCLLDSQGRGCRSASVAHLGGRGGGCGCLVGGCLFQTVVTSQHVVDPQ